MPNSVSAKKSLRQNLRRRARNRMGRSTLRSQIKRLRVAVAGDDATATEAAFRVAVKSIDQAASKGLLHKNTAARTKSRLAKLIAKPAAAE